MDCYRLRNSSDVFLRKPAGQAGKLFFCERSERLRVWGRCCRMGPFFQPQLVFRVSTGSVLQGNVPARTWVTVGY